MKKLVFTTILLLSLLSAYAQLPELSAPNVLPESPAAAAITKYIECPVDLSNGLVQISIPLYETNPNQRKGQIHYQDDSGKYLYDSQKKNSLTLHEVSIICFKITR